MLTLEIAFEKGLTKIFARASSATPISFSEHVTARKLVRLDSTHVRHNSTPPRHVVVNIRAIAVLISNLIRIKKALIDKSRCDCVL